MKDINNNNSIIQVHNICDIKLRHFAIKYPIPKTTTRLPFKRNQLDLTVSDDELNRWLYRQFPTSNLADNDYRRQVLSAEIATAYYYPLCEDRDRYCHMLQFMVYFVIMDDKNDEPAGPLGIENWDECCRVWSQVPKLVASIGGNGSDGSNGDQISNSSSSIGSQVPAVEPYVSQIEPTFTDIYRSFTSQQWRRFVDNWLDYGSGNVEQNAYNGRWFSSVDQLLKNRRKTAGVIPTTITLDYAYKFELPERDWLDPRMQTLIQLATDQIILVNDLFSFEKELMANIGQLPVTTTTGTGSDDADRQVLPQMANTVAITAVQRNCPIVEAQTVIIDTIEQLESEIIKLVIDWETGGRQSLPLSTGARQFINGLLYMAGGNYMFSIGCDRYNKFK